MSQCHIVTHVTQCDTCVIAVINERSEFITIQFECNENCIFSNVARKARSGRVKRVNDEMHYSSRQTRIVHLSIIAAACLPLLLININIDVEDINVDVISRIAISIETMEIAIAILLLGTAGT